MEFEIGKGGTSPLGGCTDRMGAGAFGSYHVDILWEYSPLLFIKIHPALWRIQAGSQRDLGGHSGRTAQTLGPPVAIQSDHTPHSTFIIGVCPPCEFTGPSRAGGMSVLVTIGAGSVPVTVPATQPPLSKCLPNKSTLNLEGIPLKSSSHLCRSRVTWQMLVCWGWEGTPLGNNNRTS